MPGPAIQPVEIELDREKELRIRWADGTLCVYPLTLLRQNCPCAACRNSREQPGHHGLPVVPQAKAQQDMTTAENAELIGQYGLRLTWKDGHDAGIYDYAALRALCPRESAAHE